MTSKSVGTRKCGGGQRDEVVVDSTPEMDGDAANNKGHPNRTSNVPDKSRTGRRRRGRPATIDRCRLMRKST